MFILVVYLECNSFYIIYYKVMNNILVPRNLSERQVNRSRIEKQKLREYIKNGSRGNLELNNWDDTKLPDDLCLVNGHFYISSTKLNDLNNLTIVTGNLYLRGCSALEYIPNDLIVGGNIVTDGYSFKRVDYSKSKRGIIVRGGIYIRTSQNMGDIREHNLFCQLSNISLERDILNKGGWLGYGVRLGINYPEFSSFQNQLAISEERSRITFLFIDKIRKIGISEEIFLEGKTLDQAIHEYKVSMWESAYSRLNISESLLEHSVACGNESIRRMRVDF